ncbi:MAG: hypothetical protein EBT75_08060 [Proteobacteria bacterium]|nr:hypothetical protein [Pseudomonadota bacterium]NBS50855.1 hypothetical protein [Verrucomicrobiota bacterium]
MATADLARDWAIVLREHIGKSAEPVPPGWLSAAQVSKIWKLSRSHTNRILTQMVTAKKAEQRIFAMQLTNQKIRINSPREKYFRRVPHYKIIKN